MTPAMLVQNSRTGDTAPYWSRPLPSNQANTQTVVYTSITDSTTVANERMWDVAFASAEFAKMVESAKAEIAAGETEPSPKNRF